MRKVITLTPHSHNQGDSNFQKTYESPQNSRRQNDTTKEVPHWGPTNIRRWAQNAVSLV